MIICCSLKPQLSLWFGDFCLQGNHCGSKFKFLSKFLPATKMITSSFENETKNDNLLPSLTPILVVVQRLLFIGSLSSNFLSNILQSQKLLPLLSKTKQRMIIGCSLKPQLSLWFGDFCLQGRGLQLVAANSNIYFLFKHFAFTPVNNKIQDSSPSSTVR